MKRNNDTFNRFLFPFWLAFALSIILYVLMNHKYQDEYKCRLSWQYKGLEVKSIVDSCHNVNRLGFVVYLHTFPFQIAHLYTIKSYVEPGDSIYKPAGSYSYYIYKKRELDSCIVVEDENMSITFYCKNCKDYYEMFNQSKK